VDDVTEELLDYLEPVLHKNAEKMRKVPKRTHLKVWEIG
jgi:predicted ABC-class ATPase